MSTSARMEAHEDSGFSSIAAPSLLVELRPWREDFFENLYDIFGPKDLLPVKLTSEPAPFWDDVFVPHPFPAANLFRSLVVHSLVLAFVYALNVAGYFDRRTPELRNVFRNTSISYYPVEEYLPPLQSPGKPAKVVRKGEPQLAKQEIISVPPEPDNTNQTIILPKTARLNHDVALPNIVLSTPVLAMQSAPVRTAPLNIPRLPVEVVEPAPEADGNRRTSLKLPQDVVAPAPDPVPSRVRSLSMQTSVVEAPPSIDELRRTQGQINMAALKQSVSEPKLPVPVQRANGAGDSDARLPAAQPVRPAPSAQGLASGRVSSGPLIALSLHPSEVKGPVEMPAGNRRGAFAAGPQGKSDAPGTPEIKGGGTATEGKGGPENSGSGVGSGKKAVEGVSVGKAPPGATISPIVGSNSPVAEHSLGTAGTDANRRDKLMAAARPPDIARPPAPGVPPKNDRVVEDNVFGSKRSYSLSLNMPNLNSTTGSWVIHFAELKPTHDDSALSAPVATTKVDPAYPPDLLRDRVEGTVVLYAVIRADGTISDIRVLRGLEERLDANAVKALGRWKFTPGSKHGAAIDLEAVVQVPFRARRTQF